MKRTSLFIASSLFLLSCNNNPKNNADNQDSITSTQQDISTNNTTGNSSSFIIENTPYSNADLGEFPFFTLPKGLKELNKPLIKKFDVCYFPIDGIMTAKEGQLYKANVTAEQGEEFSQRYFEKSISDYLTSIGATKVFEGEITREEFEKYNKQDPNKGDEGDIGYAGENIKVYAIRSKDKGNIYVQFTSNNAGGKLNILQEEGLKQTITKITAKDILDDLNAKGKSVLYINFDIDKANLTSDGKEVVSQIAAALKEDTNLKISIEGHTDNTGDAKHNKELSIKRANEVLNTLLSSQIDKSRLKAVGFGAEKPLAANDSEENKSKNRRVELIKF